MSEEIKPVKKGYAGRPKKFKTVEELEMRVNEYFIRCEAEQRPLTIEMLAFELGIVRNTLLEYSEEAEFADTIKAAKQYIYASKVEKLNEKGSNTPGVIFDLCNNGDYSNKHQEDRQGTTIIINDKSKEIVNG